MVIDTSGMMELGVESVDLSKSFADIDEISTKCKFHDCTYISEWAARYKVQLMKEVFFMNGFLIIKKLKKRQSMKG